MSYIFGIAGCPQWEAPLLHVAGQLGEMPTHTAAIPGGLIGYSSQSACSCPRRCVWKGLDCSIVLSGFLSNRAELICLVQRRKFPLSDGDDGELALALYMLFGQECVHMLHGRFTFVVYDASQQILFLARDRFGLCPLYYVQHGSGLAFSSDPQLLLALPGITPAITRQGLWQLLLAPHTHLSIWRDLRVFPAGHSAIFRNGHFTLRRSWFLRSRPCFDSGSFAAERLHALQQQALEPYSSCGELVELPSSSNSTPSESDFRHALKRVWLPYSAAPEVLHLLQGYAGRSKPILAAIGSRGLCASSPQTGVSLTLLNEKQLCQPDNAACLLPAQPPENFRLRRRQALQQLLAAASCFGSLAQDMAVSVDFPFLDHRLIEYEYNLPDCEAFSASVPCGASAGASAAPSSLKSFSVPAVFLEGLTGADSPLLPFLNASRVETALQHGELYPDLQYLAIVNEWLRAHGALLSA